MTVRIIEADQRAVHVDTVVLPVLHNLLAVYCRHFHVEKVSARVVRPISLFAIPYIRLLCGRYAR